MIIFHSTVIIGVFAHCAVVFLNVFVLRFLSHRGAETPCEDPDDYGIMIKIYLQLSMKYSIFGLKVPD